MKASAGVGLLLMVFGGVLAKGMIQFSQLSYCIGGKLFGVCLGYMYNYTWLVGVGILIVGFLVLIVGLSS